MINGLAYYCKTLIHHQTSWVIGLLLYCLGQCTIVHGEVINIYLKLNENNQIKTLIQQFNHYLTKQQLLQRYRITPFLEQYPLHVTLYLADFKPRQRAKIITIIRDLARQQRPLALSSKQFVAMSGGYMMLAIDRTASLQALSNQVVSALMALRNRQAVIPAWAAHEPARQALFARFGSPGVLTHYNPHLSIINAPPLTKTQQQRLQDELQHAIVAFSQTHAMPVHAKAYHIAIGLANQEGQITKELAHFPLG